MKWGGQNCYNSVCNQLVTAGRCRIMVSTETFAIGSISSGSRRETPWFLNYVTILALKSLQIYEEVWYQQKTNLVSTLGW